MVVHLLVGVNHENDVVGFVALLYVPGWWFVLSVLALSHRSFWPLSIVVHRLFCIRLPRWSFVVRGMRWWLLEVFLRALWSLPIVLVRTRQELVRWFCLTICWMRLLLFLQVCSTIVFWLLMCLCWCTRGCYVCVAWPSVLRLGDCCSIRYLFLPCPLY